MLVVFQVKFEGNFPQFFPVTSLELQTWVYIHAYICI